MNAHTHPGTRHLRLCEPEGSSAFEGLPADPGTSEFWNEGPETMVSMARPDRWLWIPAG
ncbi:MULTISPECIES: hypothetical protein [Mycobacteriales]|uniref:Uncharacterized protein n=1 Tax=Gordonia rubripertincta TaxID=36822 RepID=A0ABT4N3E9_GORRU|nr:MULTISPECIES: hypothetical protein [Mycobacteriales]MCZ4553798.1 hypothetical protein [Gordonia rubripertincta]